MIKKLSVIGEFGEVTGEIEIIFLYLGNTRFKPGTISAEIRSKIDEKKCFKKGVLGNLQELLIAIKKIEEGTLTRMTEEAATSRANDNETKQALQEIGFISRT